MIAVAGLARLRGRTARRARDPGARAQWPLATLRRCRRPRAGAPTAMSDVNDTTASRRPHLPARPDRRVHHRLHRLGAARQADRGAWTSSCRWTAAAPRVTDEVADTLDYKKVAKRVLAFIEASEFKLVETLAHRLALLLLAEFGARVGAHLAQQAGRDPQLARRRRGHRAHARGLDRAARRRPELTPCLRSTSPPAATSSPSGIWRCAVRGAGAASSPACASRPGIATARWASRARTSSTWWRASRRTLPVRRGARAAARHRGAVRPAARVRRAGRRASMDLDVLLYGDLVCEEPGLKLPRPDLLKRAYMLGPLAELAPGCRASDRRS